LRPEASLSRDALEERFLREADAVTRLQSQHTLSVFDFGIAESGELYLVMEFLDGQNFSQLVEESGPLPQERVVYLLRQVCKSLAESHARGLLHRDIKPSNLWVGTYANQKDFVKVMDFGAFCEFLPGKQGLVHVSELSDEFVKDVSSVVKVGDNFKVKLLEIDKMKRMNLSKKQAEQ